MNTLKKDSRTFGFGSDYNDTYLLVDPDEEDADVVEESDAYNNETFGEQTAADEEWDIEDLSQQTEILNNSTLDANGTDSGIDVVSEPSVRTSVAGDWYRSFEKSFEEMVEKSLRDLVNEDDDPSFSLPLNPGQQIMSSADIKAMRSAGGSALNPFLVVDPRTENIWGLGTTRPAVDRNAESQSSTEKISTENDSSSLKLLHCDVKDSKDAVDIGDPLQQLLSKLEMSARRTTGDEAEQQMRGEDGFRPSARVKTVQELEAELLSDSLTSEGTESLERSSIDKSSTSNCGSAPDAGLATDPDLLTPPVHPKHRVAAGALPNIHPPPAPWMLNPQLRATILACIASGKPLPHGIAPPPFPMPMTGYIARFAHFNPACIPTNVQNSELARFLVPTMRPVQTTSRVSLTSGQQSLIPVQHQNRYYYNKQQRGHFSQQQSRSDNRPPYDDYAGLMTKREREWLVKIQTLQVHCDDPLSDDYYWTMHQRKIEVRNRLSDGIHNEDKTDYVSDISSDSIDVLEILEPRTYVPPSFEGSLGKVQCSSINCPRQIIDLQATEHDGDANTGRGMGRSSYTLAVDSGHHEVSGLSGNSSISNRVSRFKNFTNLMLDIENAYLLSLECEQMLICQHGASRRLEKIKQISEQVYENARKILSLISPDSKKLCNVLLSKKGRRLILKIAPFLQDVDLVRLIHEFFNVISKKTAVNIDETFAFLTSSLEAAVDSPFERDWTKVLIGLLDGCKSAKGFLPLKEKMDGLVLVLLHCCLKNKVRLNRNILDLLIENTNLKPLRSVDLKSGEKETIENNARKLQSLLTRLLDEHDREQDSVFMKFL